jgi:hypothetical protein
LLDNLSCGSVVWLMCDCSFYFVVKICETISLVRVASHGVG